LKIGILADIHGNKTALEAVIHDCHKRGLKKYILLGDLFAKGSDPEGVFDLLKQLDVIASIRGNTDEWFLMEQLTKRQKEFITYALKNMSQQSVAYIKRMQPCYRENLFGYDSLYTHHYKETEITDKLDIIFTAHTHRSVFKIERNINIFNPGSIGNPYDHNNCASYGIIELKEKLDFQIIRIPYDIQKEKRIAIEKQVPFLERYIYAVEYGCKL
jgi:putative phosphoesterase